jgi:hypothetical protein
MSSSETPLWVQPRNKVILHDEGVVWRNGRPDYTKMDQLLREERVKHFEEGSLEDAVTNLVRVFEMEVTHKKNPEQWLSVAPDFWMTTNGGPRCTARDIAERGAYNLFIGEQQHYSARAETFDSSEKIFQTVFPDGFLWDVLEVFSPPPVVAFSWRHWGRFGGEYKGHAPTQKRVEIFGMTVGRVNAELKLLSAEHYYDNSLFLSQLASGCPVRAPGTAAS